MHLWARRVPPTWNPSDLDCGRQRQRSVKHCPTVVSAGIWVLKTRALANPFEVVLLRDSVILESPSVHWRRKWQPTPVFLPGDSQGLGNLVVFRLWGRTRLRRLSSSSGSAFKGVDCPTVLIVRSVEQRTLKKLRYCSPFEISKYEVRI